MSYRSKITPLILVSNDVYFLPYTLESIRGLFNRYIIYDVGSTDGTREIIESFINQEKNKASFFYRFVPMLSPDIQGIFRNSMIAEAQSDWYFIVDGDEVYNRKEIHKYFSELDLDKQYSESKIYGVCKRIEVSPDLSKRYSELRDHHRLYHRTAIWKGNHPGEAPVITQKPRNEFRFDLKCYHFHNALRSPNEKEVPKRMTRKKQHTYHPGELISFDLLEELPMLEYKVGEFPTNPDLEKLRNIRKIFR